MAYVAIVSADVSNAGIIRAHIAKHGAISTRDAAQYYGMTGGTLTKEISNMRRGNVALSRQWVKDTVTGRRFAQYRLTYGEIVPSFAHAYVA